MSIAIIMRHERYGALQFMELCFHLFSNMWLWITNPLAAKLESMGVTVLPPHLVRQHMRDRLLEQVPRWFILILETKATLLSAHGLLLCIATPAVTIAMLGWLHDDLLLTSMAAPFAAPYALLVAVVVIHSSIRTGEWLSGGLEPFASAWLFRSVSPETLREHSVHPQIIRRVETAQDVPGVEIREAWFRADPIIFAEQGYCFGLVTFRAAIGAYKTDSDLDNM